MLLGAALSDDDRAKLVLHVDGTSTPFAFADTTILGTSTYQWPNAGLDWSSATTVTLRLRVPVTNSAPVFSGTATTRTVPENSNAGTNVGTPVTATDADADDTLTYTLEGTDAASFTIDSGTGQITTVSGVIYNHEATKNSFTVTVKADDGNDATDTIVVTISVTDVAEQPSKPAAPTLAAVSGSATSLAASWSAPGLNGGPALTGYEVQYRAGSGEWMDFNHTGLGVTTTITGLSSDTSYQVRVRALNGETPSDWSDASTAVSTNDLPELSVADVSAQEGGSLTFTVTLSPASAVPVTVRWAASSLVANDAVAGTDYTAASGPLTFGANETSKQVMVTTLEDTTDEEDETFTLTLSNPTNAALSNGLTELKVTGTIVDDDAAPTISIAADVRVLENVESVSLTVNLSAASGKDVRFRWRRVARSGDTAEAADLREASAVESRDVVIDAGDTSSTPTARSYIVNDPLNEDDETFTLEIHAFQNATAGSKTEATVTIRNDDALPRITIGRVIPDPNEGGGVVVVPLTLSAASGREVSAIWYVNRAGHTAEAEDFADDLSVARSEGDVPAGVDERADPDQPGRR